MATPRRRAKTATPTAAKRAAAPRPLPRKGTEGTGTGTEALRRVPAETSHELHPARVWPD